MKDRTTNKRSAILDAALELISERGFHDTPVSKIASASGVSAGIIYHYFDSKDQLIQELYGEVKLDMLRSVGDGYSSDLSYRRRYDRLWSNSVDYAISHPKQMKFLEQFENSSYLKPTLPDAVLAEIERLVGFYSDGIADGVLKDLPPAALISMSVGVAAALSKQHLSGVLVLDDELSTASALACWEAISV
jgi:AcrR family transcriptional regulator